MGAWLRAESGRVLDVGSASQWPRGLLGAGAEYVALDHPGTGYAGRPAVYGDAHALPFPDATFDAVLVFDVLEHLQDPERALAGMRRVLRPGGRLILGVPFIYPQHDLPHDYARWSEAGLRALAARAGFESADLVARGRPPETAALLFNLALVDGMLDALRARRPAALLLPLVPALVLAANLCGWLLARLLGPGTRMPHAYAARWVRTPA